MSPRTGRPTEDPKKERIGFRVTGEETRKLNFCCEFFGLSKTEVIRAGIEKMYQEAQQKKNKA